MAYDVFISHAYKDKGIADAICSKLESASVKCWIAPRDISPGEDWTDAIRSAIGSSRLMVLVFSENANAAPHIEREIAHAFYTRRPIIPFRSTEALPRREFLFYLGDVRWFDALSQPIEPHLEELTARVKGLLVGPAVATTALPKDGAKRTRATVDALNSLKGETPTSRYGSRKTWKRAAIAASAAALAWLLWLASGQTNHGMSREESNLQSMNSGVGSSRNLPAQAKGDASASTPRYTYTRLGLWVAANASPTPLVQQGSQDPPSTVSASQSGNVPPSQGPDIDQKTGGEPEILANPASVTADRREGRRGKSRKRHIARYAASERFGFDRIRSWLIRHFP
jgi:hypothetical protein